MTTAFTHIEQPVLYVIHPLDDAPEQKKSIEGLGYIHMSPSVKFSLYALRGYLLLIMVLALYRMLDLLHVFGHHVTK